MYPIVLVKEAVLHCFLGLDPMPEADSFKANTLYIRTEENSYSLELDSGLLSLAMQ
jgi:hypothetical protein